MSPAEQTPRRTPPLHPSARAAPRPQPPRPPQAGSAAATGRAPPRLPSKADRPSPQSQSFSQSYGSNLPTSLTYIVPSTRGCSPWRPAAVMGTAGCQCNPLPRIFTGPRECTGRRQRCDAWPGGRPYLGAIPFQGCTACRKEKRTLPGTRAGVSELARVAAEADGRRDRTPTLHSGSGMLTRFPFGTSADRPRRGREPARTGKELTRPSGPTHPRPNAVHAEPFPTSVFKVLI